VRYVAASSAHSASANTPTASGKGASQGAKNPLATMPSCTRMLPDTSAPTIVPSRTGAMVLAIENTRP
jgi:hypothetical protein